MGVFSKKLEDLLKVSQELSDLGGAMALLSWDQEVMMPPKGAKGRAEQLATLAGIYHNKLTNPAIGKLIKQAEANMENDYDRALLREMTREYEKAVAIPQELVEEISNATSNAYESWAIAKKNNDFGMFAPDLERILGLKIKAAKILQKPGQSLYDVMLDDYEAGLTEAEVERVFAGVKPKLVKLVKEISEKCKDWNETPEGVEETSWEEFVKKTVSEMGYDWEAGRLDPTAHPFETTISSGDVRITTWKDGKDWKEMLMAAMHESGHALYEQGVNSELSRTHLAGGQGLVLHESQSRLWENLVGRSKEFWSGFPIKYWQAVNIVKPSPVRVLADEVTYGLHIILRFEIEQIMINDEGFRINDLPALWNKKMEEFLGITPKNDAEGVLQDVHWSHGSFGYFPTYFLGTMAASQLWRAVNDQIPNTKDQINAETMKEIREWLRENVHRHGRVYTSKELIKRVTGEELNPKYFLEYLEEKFS